MLYSEIAAIKVSRLGFGCMRLPVKEDGSIDRPAVAEMVDEAYRAGVNYYDTAYNYHGGDSERCIGEALARYPRDSYLLATKLPVWLLETETDVDRLFAEQLQKTGMEYLDFYLLHALDRGRWEAVRKTKTCEQLSKKKQDGLIRALGFSYHGDFDTFCEILDAYEWDFVQLQINYLDYTMMDSKAYYDKLAEKGIPCVVMEPVRGGFLANLPESARAEQLAVNGDTAASWALRWCMDMGNMPLILSGMSALEQVRENVRIFSEHRPLTAEEHAGLERCREAILAIKTIPCTACGYCMDCPFGVDIPGVFRIYNEYKLFQIPFIAKAGYDRLGEGQGGACTRCGACAPMCPQGIDIPDRLAEVHAELSSLQF